MANFLRKAKDLTKVDLSITFPTLGSYMIKEAKEIEISAPEDSFTMTDADIKGNVSTISTGSKKREIKVVTTKGSDDDIFLSRCLRLNAGLLGTLVYIDDTGDNKVSGTGEGVSIQKAPNRKNNTKDIDIEYTIQCAKYTELV